MHAVSWNFILLYRVYYIVEIEERAQIVKMTGRKGGKRDEAKELFISARFTWWGEELPA